MNSLDFEAVYKEWSSYVYSLAYRLTGNKVDAEDVAQETFLRIHRFLKDYKGGSFKGWLYKIVTNAFYLKVDKDKRGPLLPGDENLMNNIADRSLPTQLEQLNRQELEHWIHEAIGTLPPEFRTALVLADLEELSYQEISEIIGVPIGTVRSRISRARTMLKGRLIQKGDE